MGSLGPALIPQTLSVLEDSIVLQAAPLKYMDPEASRKETPP